MNYSTTTFGLAITSAVLGSALFGINSVQAATFTYNLTNSTNINSPLVTLPGNLPAPTGAPTLAITATNEDGTTGDVAVRANGTGVGTAPNGAEIASNATGTEILTLTFDREVILNTITFGNIQANDGFGIRDGNGNSLFSVPTLSGNNPFTLTNPLQGLVFSFFAPENNDDYLIQNITINTIPEPSSILGLFIFGTLNLISWQKRK